MGVDMVGAKPKQPDGVAPDSAPPHLLKSATRSFASSERPTWSVPRQ